MLIRSNLSRINEKPNTKFKKFGNDLKLGEALKQSRDEERVLVRWPGTDSKLEMP